MPKKSFHRTDRVSAQLRRELGAIVHAVVREHGLPSVSVSDVEITRDMAHAKVFFTALQSERAKEALKGLSELAPEIRRELSHAVRMRHTPELHFHYDDSVDRGERIDTLLRRRRAAIPARSIRWPLDSFRCASAKPRRSQACCCPSARPTRCLRASGSKPIPATPTAWWWPSGRCRH
jgi:ribosome-binding factor A